MNFSEIYKIHSSLVYNLALNYTQNVQDAEEVTQNVFLSIHEKLDKFKDESQLKTWIYRITINKSLDYIKAKKSQKRWSFLTAKSIDDQSVHLPDSTFNHPGVILEQKEAMKYLFKLINELPKNQKTALLLLKVDQLEMKEVAEIMEISYKALESLFQRAKKNLKILIEKTKEYEK